MKRKVIVTNNLRVLKKHLGSRGKDITYFVLEENMQSGLIRDYLSLQHNSTEIADKKPVGGGEHFIRAYSVIIYRLNSKSASRVWWAMNFTNKNPLLTGLCKNIYDALNIIKLIEQNPCEIMVIVSSNAALKGYIKRWAENKDMDLSIFMPTRINLKYVLSRIPLLFITYAFLRSFLRMLLSRMLLGAIKSPLKRDYAIITQFEKSSFSSDGSFYDTYFGRLREFLKKEKKSFITCGYVSCAFKNITRQSKLTGQQERVFPLEHFISLVSLLRCFGEAASGYFKRHIQLRDIELNGEDVSWFIKKEIDSAFNAGQVFVNLSVFYSVKDLLKRSSLQTILYPFENRAWEKMILLAASQVSNIKTVGYQHASLTPKHINFILEEGEAVKFPFPDQIITMGRVTKDIMIDLFNFPKDKLKVGCALRKALPQINSSGKGIPGKIGRILIALASSVDEYVGVLRFLDSAFSKGQPYKLVFRPHPAIDFKKALGIYKPKNIKYELDNLPLSDSVKAADILIYASSTVSMEAVALGIPVVFIDLDDMFNSDPMFNNSYLKWRCLRPEELPRIIESIPQLDGRVFLGIQQKAKEFAQDYCVEATESAMGAFI